MYEPRRIPARIRRVRAAKAAKLARCGSSDLTPEELDRVLPAVECLRTRLLRQHKTFDRHYRELRGRA